MKAAYALVLFCLVLALARSSNGQYAYSRLDEVGSYSTDWISVQWGFVDDDDGRFYFNVTAATTGWVGIGLNEAGGTMPAGDFMVASVADDDEEFSEVTLTDRYATAYETPRLDDRQDLTLISGNQITGVTNFLFYRDAVTGDGFDRAIRKGEQQELSLAIGSSDSFSYHSRRSHRLIDMYAGATYANSKDGWDGDRVGHYQSPGEHFEIEWGFAGSGDSEVIVWKIKAKTTGWVGLGLSNDYHMTNSDMIIVSVADGNDDDDDKTSSTPAYVQDRYIGNSYEKPHFDQSQDVSVLYAQQEGGYTYVGLSRKTVTGDAQDREITPDDDDEYMLWALGTEDELHIHFEKGSTHVNWYSGSTSDPPNYSVIILVHGVVMIASWILLAAFSAGLVRYSKSLFGDLWLPGHIVLAVLALLLCVIGFILGVVGVGVNGRSHFSQYHTIAGLLITVAALLQPILASIFRFPGLSGVIVKKAPSLNIGVMLQHRWFGWLIIIFAFINIGTGLHLYTTNTGIWVVFGIWVGVIILAWFLFELGMSLPGWNESLGRVSSTSMPKFETWQDFVVFVGWVVYTVFALICFVIIVTIFAVYSGSDGFAQSGGSSS